MINDIPSPRPCPYCSRLPRLHRALGLVEIACAGHKHYVFAVGYDPASAIDAWNLKIDALAARLPPRPPPPPWISEIP